MENGEIDIERYRSDGHIHDEAALAELFQLSSDDEEAPANHDAATRK